LSNEPFVDMLIVVLENSKKPGEAIFKRVVGNSRRIAKSFAGCEVTLEPGCYTVACLAFKHWQTGKYMFKIYLITIHVCLKLEYLFSFYLICDADNV